jgi:hypothetical protein
VAAQGRWGTRINADAADQRGFANVADACPGTLDFLIRNEIPITETQTPKTTVKAASSCTTKRDAKTQSRKTSKIAMTVMLTNSDRIPNRRRKPKR